MARKTFESICKEINWVELSEQKRALLKQVNSTTGRTSTQLKNLVKFIEKLQDAATDEYGVSMELVHPILTKVKLINQSQKNIN